MNIRDPQRTREKILAAALAEFSAKGFAGARVGTIARRARVNKRMLYHYFGAKRELYQRILRNKIEERNSFFAAAPEDPIEGLLYWYEMNHRDLAWVRMQEWEALGSNGGKLLAEKERRALFEKAAARLRRAQAMGRLDPAPDTGQLFISMLALTTFPLAFPQMVRLITGLEPTDPRFRRKRIDFLRWLGERLRRARPEPRRRPGILQPVRPKRYLKWRAESLAARV